MLTLDFNLMHDFIVFSKVHIDGHIINNAIKNSCLVLSIDVTLCTRIVCLVELTKDHLQEMFIVGLMDSNVPVQTFHT